ncbi:DNA repair protein XRCC2-like [Eriocheir sinensis]|uniref:DNA repair protein XRCC2-like n=1 Tax=Eriocheir sinensis TaxID=95602 RepID=UPI0021C7A82B|nr:DNA repair protein XRCC2-like [Eriocheir sinensis]XP_050717900.1 DNA repair protein XRCC2-like [Eriocheir sinensis]
MSEVTPTGAVPKDACMEGFEGSALVGSKCGTSTPLHKSCLTNPPTATLPSPLACSTPPSHNKHQTAHATHTPKAATPYAGVTYMVEYMREEGQSTPLPLDPHLFPGGLQPGDVVEVWGNTGCGKSVLTLSLVASALLPAEWCGIELGGCSTGVTFIDCDQHFSIFQLVNLMYKKVKAQIKLAKDALNNYRKGKTAEKTPIHSVKEVTELLKSNKASLKTKIEEMVQDCLKSLYYIKCVESVQFPIVFASMEEHLAKHSDVSLVVVDSLSAFCWYDWAYQGAGKFYRLKEYYDRVLSVLLANIRKYKVVLLTVKQALFLKSLEETPRMDQAKDEEEPYHRQEGKGQRGEIDVDMAEGDDMENMKLSEYLGYEWVSSVTWRVILSKVRASSLSPSSVSPKGSSSRNLPHRSDVMCEEEEAVFSAEVVKDKQRKWLFFVIDEEGVIWRQAALGH